jgi:hypothetical protein
MDVYDQQIEPICNHKFSTHGHSRDPNAATLSIVLQKYHEILRQHCVTTIGNNTTLSAILCNNESNTCHQHPLSIYLEQR